VEELFSIKKHLKLTFIITMQIVLFGCSSVGDRQDNIHVLEKKIIELESHVQVDSMNVPLRGLEGLGGDDRFVVKPSYPGWVTSPKKHFSFSVGVACRDISERSYQDEINGKMIANDQALLDLFQKGAIEQKLFAKEKLLDGVDGSDYSVVIKKQTFGQIGMNKMVKEGYFRLNGQKVYCVALTHL
jgi:hypothetical protein